MYGSLRERFALEWKIYALAFAFILVADNIGQIKIPAGKGNVYPVPDFLCDYPGCVKRSPGVKIVDNKHVKAASNWLWWASVPLSPSWESRRGQTSTPFFSPVRSFFFMDF